VARLDPHSYADSEQPVTERIDLQLKVDFARQVLSGEVLLTLRDPSAGPLDLDTRDLRIAALGGEANAFVTESLNPYCSAPEVPPATFALSPTTCAMVFNAVATDASVHLVLCALSDAYFAGPNVRR